MADDKLTQEYRSRFGTLSVHRGRDIDEKELFSWEPIPACNDIRCPLRNKCDYTVKDGNKCKVVAGIVMAAAINIMKNFGNKINNAQRNRVGKHLMPLYVSLARLYVYEASLESASFTDNKGNPKINPVYKEIRETIRGIDLQWKNIGLGEIPIEEGDENWYTRMESEAQDQMKRRRTEGKETGHQVIKLKPREE